METLDRGVVHLQAGTQEGAALNGNMVYLFFYFIPGISTYYVGTTVRHDGNPESTTEDSGPGHVTYAKETSI